MSVGSQVHRGEGKMHIDTCHSFRENVLWVDKT